MSMPNIKPHAVLLASPGMGHLIPVIELAKCLHTHHGFLVTVVVVTTTSSQNLHHISQLSSLNVLTLPPLDVSHKFGPNHSVVVRISLTMIESVPLLRSSILSMNPRPSALIVDLFGTPALPMARELGMLSYVFLTSNAWFSALIVYFPVIDKKMEDRHVIHHEPLRIPSCKSIPFEDTFEPFLNRDGPMYESFLKRTREIVSADGILVNTWQDMEPRTIKTLLDRENLGGIVKGAIHFVGPLLTTIESKPKGKSNNNNVLQWLDAQPVDSVIYVSFGSGGTLSTAQLTELAWGLELSQQKFVWVVRPPKENDSSGTFFNVGKRSRMQRHHGLLARGFRGEDTECGEGGANNGVGMVAWPLFAEQRMNARMLTEELKVAVRVNAMRESVVGREEIGKAVRRIMVEEEGRRIRLRVKELKVSGEKALSKFGSSHESLCQMTKDCLNYLQGSF
ncbi:UDP-glycosyltransferase 72E1-like [Senna tora]|uniref:UDP-glycosyltransferase 72E1-like n=1 Tax=Senna tora TaxID=362788 RepID=A0A834XGV2_9FABA|nr:UDP-glycosyltransferase 72E1-like [Senna tora]